MKLKRGIALDNRMPQGDAAVHINSGTVPQAEQVTPAVDFNGHQYTPQYESYAYVAKRDWRSLRADELKCITASGERTDFNTVYLGEIPGPLKESFKQLALTESNSREDVVGRFVVDQEKTKALNSNLNAFLTALAGGKPFQFRCIGVNFPNLEMVGCDMSKLPRGFQPADIKYMGMHNDGTQKMTVYTAHKTGNRISINLGSETRYFLFVNLSMVQALNMLKEKIDIKEVNIGNIPRFFFRHFPDYPVLRVQLEPYQYYIAPTDNCFHDGSTLGNTALDIAIVYFGSFQH